MSEHRAKPLSLLERVARLGRLLRSGLLGRFVMVLAAVGLIPLIIIPWLVQLTRDSVTDQILTTHSVTARSPVASRLGRNACSDDLGAWPSRCAASTRSLPVTSVTPAGRWMLKIVPLTVLRSSARWVT